MLDLSHQPIPASNMRMLQDVLASWLEEHKVALHDDRAERVKNEIFDLYQLGVNGHDTLLEMIRSI
jgi:hypothetical protein